MSDGPYTPPPAPVNPFAMIGQMAGAANAVQQNVLMRKTIGAQQAVGQHVQQATGADGQLDLNAFMSGVAHDPNAAFGAQGAAEFAQTQRQAQLAVHTQQLANAHAQWGVINDAVGSLMQKPNVSAKDVTDGVGNLVAMGVIDAKTGAAELAGMPTNEQELPNWLRGHLVRGMQTQQQIEAMIGPQTAISTGGETEFVRAPTLADTSATPQGVHAPLANTPSPDTLASPASYTDASGTPHTTTVAGVNAATQGGSHPIAGPAPGVVPAAQTGAVAGAQAASQLGKEVETAKGQKATLELMRGDLAHMPATGPSATMLQHIKTLGSEWGIGVNDNEVASTQGFKKFAAQIVSKAYAGMPTGSDRTLGEIVSGNPSLDISTLSNKRLIDYLEAAQDMKLAEAQAWAANKKRGVGDEHFNDFRSWFHQQMDPRYFMSQYQDAGERQQLLSSMTKSDKAKFLNGLTAAKKAGLVK